VFNEDTAKVLQEFNAQGKVTEIQASSSKEMVLQEIELGLKAICFI
jgi:hypothetical protein